MHEMSVAQNLIDVVISQMKEHGLSNIEKINLKIGEMSGIQFDALVFCFDIIKKDTPLSKTVLQAEFVKALFECRRCGKKYRPEAFDYRCPVCKDVVGRVIEGERMTIDSIEGE